MTTAKKVTFGEEARKKMLRGMDIVADAVGGTIGPKGRNVYIQQNYGSVISNDGFSIASRTFLEDPEEDLGAYVIRNVCGQQNDKVGDGTTTVAVLTQAIIHECLKRPENPMEIRSSLNESLKEATAQLKEVSTAIEEKDIERVALISAEDPLIARIISDVIKKLGKDAVINIEDSKTLNTSYEVVEGYEAKVGYLIPHFADPKTGKATLSDVPILVTEKKISNVIDIKPLFEKFAAKGITSCVIVCDDIDDGILGIFVANKLSGRFAPLVIKAHGDELKDIEGATGARMVSDSRGVTFQNITLEDLGFAKKVVADAHKTTFILGESSDAKEYADLLERQAEIEENQYVKQRLEERIAQLRGGIAVVRVAAPTDLEREYLKLKAEDAVKAVQAALAEGVVEGAGFALWRIASKLKDNTVGNAILKKVLTAPARRIIENAGKAYDEVILSLSKKDEGYNAKENKTMNLIESGIIDPTKVERVALENAVSAAGAFITSFCLITDIPNEHQENRNQ